MIKLLLFVLTVSIPYRQGKNGALIIWNTENRTMFQFLIGRLKTPSAMLGGVDCTWFQFLIGRLKTKNKGQITIFENLVSIPYRQAKNLEYSMFLCYTQEFQFLIGRLKTWVFDEEKANRPMFQFLIGRLKTPARKPFLQAV